MIHLFIINQTQASRSSSLSGSPCCDGSSFFFILYVPVGQLNRCIVLVSYRSTQQQVQLTMEPHELWTIPVGGKHNLCCISFMFSSENDTLIRAQEKETSSSSAEGTKDLQIQSTKGTIKDKKPIDLQKCMHYTFANYFDTIF